MTETQRVLLTSYVVRLGRDPMPGKEAQGEIVPGWPPTAESAGGAGAE